MLTVPTSLYLLLGTSYLFLSFLSLRNMFLLLGIPTWLSVRVPRGSFGYLSQVFDRKKGVESTEAQRIARGRVFPMALFSPAHRKALYVRTLNFSLSVLKKDTSKAWMWYKVETFSVLIQYADFFAIYCGVPKCCEDQGSNSMSQEVWNISVWSYFTSEFEADRTSKSGWCFKRYLRYPKIS